MGTLDALKKAVRRFVPRTKRETTPRTRTPGFIIAGAQKAGTTFLFNFLSRHPGLGPACEKEVRFFSQDVAFQRGAQWYRQFFHLDEEQGREQLMFEASPDYLYSPVAAARIAEFDPKMKLIVSLRNPAERAYSAWNMYRQVHERPVLPLFPSSRFDEHLRDRLHRLLHSPTFPAFEEAVQAELDEEDRDTIETDFVSVGYYDVQLQRYLDRFAREQLLVITREAMLREPRVVAKQITEFLDIAPFDWPDDAVPRSGVADYDAPMSVEIEDQLNEIYRPHNARLIEMIGFDPGWPS